MLKTPEPLARLPGPDDPMYAVTIHNERDNPWVDLILSGHKRYEFRPWRPRKFGEGEWFGIHESRCGIRVIAHLSYVAETLWHWEINKIFEQPGAPTRREFTRRLEDPKQRPMLAWCLGKVVPIILVRCMGTQGVWEMEPEVREKVLQQVRESDK